MIAPRNTRVANLFMLAQCWDNYTPPRAALVMPKLNGIRAMYVPGEGWFSRDGVQYANAVLGHIEVKSKLPVDGELYVHGWSLQRINAAAGVNLLAPVEDSARVEFHAFDVVNTMATAMARATQLCRVINDSKNVVAVEWSVARDGVAYDGSDYEDLFTRYIRDGYEGAMYKDLMRPYIPGRTTALLKRKNWSYIPVRVLEIKEGLGKFAGMFGGALVCARDNPALTFNVGVGKDLTDDMRRTLWREPARVLGREFSARYLVLSDDGKPLNATIKLLQR